MSSLLSRDAAALWFGIKKLLPSTAESYWRTRRWRSPEAAVTLNYQLPMHSLHVENSLMDDIKSLRLVTAIKTPFLPDGRFDLEAYDSLMQIQIAKGAEGVIVGGTAREGHLMSWDEHIMLNGHTVNWFGSSIKVIGNTGSNSTGEGSTCN